LLLGIPSAASALQDSPASPFANSEVPQSLSAANFLSENLSAPRFSNPLAEPFTARLAPIDLAADSSAPPEPSPEPPPRFVYGSREDYRWQIALGYEYIRFFSPSFDANLNGFHTSFSYFTNEWFALEGSFIAALGEKVFANETTRYLLFAGGPKI